MHKVVRYVLGGGMIKPTKDIMQACKLFKIILQTPNSPHSRIVASSVASLSQTSPLRSTIRLLSSPPLPSSTMEACVSCLSPATVYCQADQASLCTACDEHIHSANKLSQRHIRSPLPASSSDSSVRSSVQSVNDIDQRLASIAGIFVKKEAAELLQRTMAYATNPPTDSYHTDSYHTDPRSKERQRERQEALKRFRTKRANRTFGKKVRYECRKQLADSRPRVKGRFVGRKTLSG